MTLDLKTGTDTHISHQNLPSTSTPKNTNQQAGLLTDSDDDDDDEMMDDEMQTSHRKYVNSHQSLMIGGASLEGSGGAVIPSSVERKSGRRKIRIEYIEEKGRRHITFSKRKAGIMKKAYELSTLTGTQVLLLVASETGHVYTFATPKLQPLITKPEGKNLIQACLNSPDTTTIMNEMGFDDCEEPQQQQHGHNLTSSNEYCVMAGGRMVGGMVSAPLASTTSSSSSRSLHHSAANGASQSVPVPSGMLPSPYYNPAFTHPSSASGNSNNTTNNNSYAMAANYWQHQTSSVSNIQSAGSSGNVNIGHANNAK